MKCFKLIFFVLVLDFAYCKYNKHPSYPFSKDNTIKYYTKQPYDFVIPIMIHLDKSLMRTFPREPKGKIKDKFKILAKNFLKDAEELFSAHNLNRKVKLVLLDVKILRNNTKKVVMSENVSQYLKSYCQWQGTRKVASQKWYFSVLFTGLDLYYLDTFGTKVRSSTGRGYQRGLCSNRNSCALLEWHPQNIAFILTHEIAHSLGVSHDGQNECHGQRYVMSATYNPRNPPKIWSACSKRELDIFLKSRQAWCLNSYSNMSLH